MSKTRTRVWSIILAFAMVVSLLPATALAVGGTGTVNDPYLVASAQDMTDALNQSGPEIYIRLSGSFIVDSAQNWTIGSGKSVVLDLAGHTLTNTYDALNYYVLKVNGGSLTLEDSSPAKMGTIDVNGSNSYGIRILGTGSTFIMNGGTVTSEGKCALDMYALTRNATVMINGGKLATEKHTNAAIGVRGSDTTFTMRGGEIDNPSGMWAVFASADSTAPVDSLTLTFDGGKITSNDTGIYIDYPITVNFGGTAEVIASGYGIDMSGTGVLNMTGGTVQSDSAAIYSDESSVVNVSGGSLTGTQALRITEDSTAQITNGMFTGDVEGETTNITIEGGTFTTADVSGYLPEGMDQDDSTGEITISGDAVASIGNRGYLTLGAALTAAISGDVILLRNNVELDSTLTIDSTKSGITIDGDGQYTISPSTSFSSGKDLVLVTGDNVTIRNLTVDGKSQAKHGIQFYCAANGAIENVTSQNNNMGCGILINASTVTASGTIKFENNGWGNAINVGFGSGIDDAPGASLDVTNATLEGVTAIYADASDVQRAGEYSGPGGPVTITVKDANGKYVAIADGGAPIYFIPVAAASTVITVENPDGEVLRYTKTTSLPAAIDAAKDGAVITLADGDYDVTTNREIDSTHYGSDLIIDKNDVTIQAADDATPVIYGFTNKYSGGTGDEGICGQSTVFVSGRNVTLQDLTIMPLGAYEGGDGNWYTTKAVEVTKGATGFVMTGCEITENTKTKDELGAHHMVGGGLVYFETNDATLDLNIFRDGTVVTAGWLNPSDEDDGYYSVDASGNYWGENADYDDIAAMLGDGVTVNDWYTHLDADGTLSGLRVEGGVLIVADPGMTGATVTFPDAISGDDYEVASGGQVNFTIRLEDETEVQDVYAAYSPDGTGTRYLTVTPVTSTIYTFTAPDAADFSAGVDKTVTVYVTTNSTAKSEVTLDLELDGTKEDLTSGSAPSPDYITAGSTLTAVVTVQDGTGNDITDATGAGVQFTWPDGTITYGYVNGSGTATSQWTPSDTFANGLYVGDSDWTARQKEVTVEFFGTEKYKSATTQETVTIKSRTIAPVADLAIVATPNGGGLNVQQLDVLSTYALSLSESNNPVLNAQGVKLKNNIDYTFTWYVNNGNGEWTELTDVSAVTPKNINTRYKVVFTPIGEYSLGGFELVIGCGELKGTTVTTTTNVDADQPLYEGQFLRVTATVTDEDGNAVTSGEVVFYAERQDKPEWTPTELGRVALVNDGHAALSLTNLPAGEYAIAAYYLGAEGVYAASEGESPAFEIQSATLPETGWSIVIGDGSETNISVGKETTLSISAPAGVVAADYRVEWLVSKDGGETWLLAGNDATLTITPANNLYQYRALVYPTGNYTQPVNGIALTKVTASANDQIATALTLSMMPESVFEGETFILRAQVMAGTVPVTGGYVTFTTTDGFSYAAPVDAAGYAEVTILGGVSAKTDYTATYTDPSKIYQDSTGTLTVTPNTREIEMKVAYIKADPTDFTVGTTVVLTPPAVFAKGSDTQLTAGRDFYYQWQYSTDYAGGAGDYTATWLNFSAPLAGGSTNENAIRVTIGDANTAFRVIAVPYGNYQYPAGGVVTNPICGNADKIQTETRISIRSLENGTEIFDGDEVLFSAKVLGLNGNPVTEGFVQFSIALPEGGAYVLGTALVNDEGMATLTTTVYADKMESVIATYFGTSKYAASTVTDDLNINSATIAVQSGIIGTFAVNEETSVTLPVVIDANDTAKVLTKDVDYYIVWYVDDGEGWYELIDPEYANGSLKFTPANENTRLAAVVFPMGDYMFPVDGIAAGVIGNATKVTTATTLTISGDWHEGSTITLTAAVKADQTAVLDGKVEFYATIGGTASVMIGSAALNKDGAAVLNYTLPAYNATNNSISFTANYIGTDVYAASEATASDGKILSATITFGADPKITIADAKGSVDPADVQVGAAYTLTAPAVYETGATDATDSPLTYGEDYYYVWQYSEDGKTWETVYSTMVDGGNVYENAVFGNENAEYRAVAYPIIASGTTYRYPATGIVVATSLRAKTIDTATELAIGNAYVVKDGTNIYPEGRTITLTATVAEQDRSSVPAYGTVKFYYKNDSTSAGKAVPLGTMSLDPGGSATLSIAAPAATGSAYIFYAVFEGNTVYAASSSDYTTGNVFVLPNEIALTGEIAIYDADGNEVDATDAVVGTAYTLKGATATVKSDDATAPTVLDYIKAVNDAVAAGKAPAYYSYVWQKSEDGGKTWTNLANNTDTLKDVTFDSSLTMYRLAAFPVESTGWVAPTEGVTSNEVSVGKQSTDVTITLTDVATGTVLANKSNAFEGAEVQVTVDVSKVADKLGTDGTVELVLVRGHSANPNRERIEIGSADVNNAGKAVFTVVLPAYSYDPANGLSNQINFKVTFTGDDYFAGDTLNVGETYLNLSSAAITWKDQTGTFTDAVKSITIYEGTEAKGTTVTEMAANGTYTLAIPEIYAGDVYSTGVRKNELLTVNEDYTVAWQVRMTGENAATWRTLDGASGDTYTVTCTEGQEKYSYRAVITPMGDYSKAMDLIFGELTPSATLTTLATADTELAATTTKLEVSGTVAEEADVAIGGETPFTAVGEHQTQYEGADVTLTATVANADGKVNDGLVYFYRNGEKLNDVGVKVDANGVATLTVATSAWDDAKSVTGNVDSYYADYEGTTVFDKSSSKIVDPDTSDVTGLVDVYVRSTTIATPRISATYLDGADTTTKYTTSDANLDGLPAAVEMTFALVQNNTSAISGYSVTATDGRWLKEGVDFTMQWYRENPDVSEGGSESNVNVAIDGATESSYVKDASSLAQKFSIFLTAIGNMKTGAWSKQAIIGDAATPELALDIDYSFEPDAADLAGSVVATAGAHYGDSVTLTATVKGDEAANALPTGTVTFYYRTRGNNWTQLGDPVSLVQKDTAENKLVAIATYTLDTTKIPFNITGISFSYSGDSFYDPFVEVDAQKDNAETYKAFKLWSIQISNPIREGIVDMTGYTPDYNDPACYPDGKSYGNLGITIYKVDDDGNRGEEVRANASGKKELQAETEYILEIQDVYTKSGEKLNLAKDNSADITVEWYKSTDNGKTWGPLPETEYTNLDAETIQVTPATKDYQYMVKIITTPSFYNSQFPELEDFEYSEDGVVITTLQDVTVSVTAKAETPVNGNNNWVYQANPITLFATVSPVEAGEPTGTVEFYYTVLRDGATVNDDGTITDIDGNAIDLDEDIWTAVVSDGTDGGNTANLVETTSATDVDAVMVAELTTSSLPVDEDGTYSNLVIKAVYLGDATFKTMSNITSGDPDADTIASSEIVVFSSKILQNENIPNHVLTFTKDADGTITGWTYEGKTGDLYDGVIITAKTLKSDGTSTVITLNPVYTIDANDRDHEIFTTSDDLAAIYTLTAGVDYEVEWQYCANYEAYKQYLSDPATYDKNWQQVDDSLVSNYCTVEQVQGYAYRAVVTPLDTEKAQQSFQNADRIYSNILVVEAADARLLTNIRNASSASANGDTVYVDAIVMGGTTTPIGNVTLTVKEKGTDKVVFTETQNLVNGWTTFKWQNVQPGEYTLKLDLDGNNGYEAATITEDYIVRFTAQDQSGDAGVPGVLTLTVNNPETTYNGQVQMLGADAVTLTGFTDNYVDWKDMALATLTFQYYDEDGNRVAEPKDAGTYQVKAYLPESMYWGYVAAEGTYTIAQRKVEISDVIAQDKVYNGDTTANIQTIELALSPIDAKTGLPTGDTGLVEGDSLYVQANGVLSDANAGTRTLTLDRLTLMGPDANNYVIANPDYSESFTVSRNMLKTSAVTAITAAPGYELTDLQFFMIDQYGTRITTKDAEITYLYHDGNDITPVENTNLPGKYTVLISMDETNYNGGAALSLYIVEGFGTAQSVGTVNDRLTSAVVEISNTYHVYDGTAKSVTVTPADATVEYAGTNGQYSAAAPMDAGRYMVRATKEDMSYYGIMTIVKGEPQFDITASSAAYTYTGNRYNGGVSVSDLDQILADSNPGWDFVDAYEGGYLTYVGGSIVGYDYNAPRDVSYDLDGAAYDDSVTSGAYGTYVVTAHYPETANTVAVTASAEYEITKAPLTITGDDIYTRRFDTHSKLTATYKGFVGELGSPDSELRDLIALPTFQLSEDLELTGESLTNVGNLPIILSKANARNYKITYVNGIASTAADSTQDDLAIRGIPSTIYYGDSFQLFLYGSSDGTTTNESSAVTWTSSNPDIATIDEFGKVTINGVGDFTITAVRGDDPDTQIKITSATLTALARRNDFVVAREDVLYDGTEKTVGADLKFYYMSHGTRFVNDNPPPVSITLKGTDAGEYLVGISYFDPTATETLVSGSALLAIHRAQATVTTVAEMKVYGDENPALTYETNPDGVLTGALVETSAFKDSDTGVYELLVAGGTADRNYVLAYTLSDVNADFTVTKKALTFTVGSLADTNGQTKQWRTITKDGTLGYVATDLASAVLEQHGDRVFGERNQILDYEVDGLILGDSLADLWDASDRADIHFAQLNKDFALSAEAAANRELDGTTISHEVGTIDHAKIEEDIQEAWYVITGNTSSRNYDVTYENGTQNVTQRKVSIANTVVAVPAGTTAEDLITVIGPQLSITGLAANLNHNYTDLLLGFETTVDTAAGAGQQTVKLTCGNTNYVLDDANSTITVVIGEVTGNGYFIEREEEYTILRLQRTLDLADGTTLVEPATGIVDLELTIKDPDTEDVLEVGTMTEITKDSAEWDSTWDDDYAYYILRHESVDGHRTIYRLKATGYNFNYKN